jgi:alkanesulfonate monooxygenase
MHMRNSHLHKSLALLEVTRMKEIVLNAFTQCSVTHSHQGLWRHPRDRSFEYKSINYWIEFAQLLERGKFDGVFFADGNGIPSVYGGSNEAALRVGSMVPKNDPAFIIPAMAAATKHLGYGVTFNVNEEVLDHVTNGRIGWNIVTGASSASVKARGGDGSMGHDERYDLADEFMDIVYQLWEKCWDDDAMVRDVARNIVTEPGRVHRIKHEGRYFNVDAVHLCEPSPQRTPLLFQAGGSPRGVAFAARHAECAFINGATPELIAPSIKKLRDAAAAAGRDPQSVKTIVAMTVITGPTDDAAKAKHEEYLSYLDRQGNLVRLSSFMGTDLSKLALDAPVDKNLSTGGGITSIAENLKRGSPNRNWTVGDIANSLDPEGSHPVAIGGPKTIADIFERWVSIGDVDGFNLAQTVKPECMADFIEYVVPELQRRGIYKKEYRDGTLREKVMAGEAKTPSDHPSAKMRMPTAA